MDGEMINILTSLHYWLKEEYLYVSRKEACRKATDTRFCRIAVDLAISDGEELEEDALEDDPEF